ncbi:MAG: putative 4-hydroxybenzoate polyprenyltransferase [Selenomonadaceae bacterium]|nr:putative 4-hydroxybenzoate polyprenyltransferase [Selenomonadaceae bacterium]
MVNVKAHINNIALSHTIFDLPFAFMGAILATGGRVEVWTLFLIAMAVTSGRAAALAIDNLADLKFDKLQPRMANRAMVKGEISRGEAMKFILLCLLIMVITVAQLPPICLKLLPLAAIPFIIYPFTKRFTGWCHVFLGVAISMAPAGGWVAAGGEVFAPAIIFLCMAVILWMAGFDALYGAQDEKFDKAHGLHSLTTEFGAKKAFKISKIFHVLCVICFAAVGITLGLGIFYFLGVLIAALTLIYQHKIVSPTNFSQITQEYFMRNGIVSVAICFFTWINFW